MAKVLGALIPASAITALGIILAALGTVPWWTVPASIITTGWLCGTAGAALERSRLPWVRVSQLQLDKRTTFTHGQSLGLFFVVITNGPIPTKVLPLIVRVAESPWTIRLEHSWEGHWRGRLPKYEGDLRANEEAQYGLLAAARFANSNPGLFIFSREASEDPEKHQLIRITQDIPISEQGTVTVDLHVACEFETDGRTALGRGQLHTFTILPDQSTSSYNIGPITSKPQHWLQRWPRVSNALQAAMQALRADDPHKRSRKRRTET
jgi:hypothetical protein